MTQEEKAKRYDEAIKRAKYKIKNNKDHVLYEDDVIEIFPELADSEDERTRKEILNYIIKGSESCYDVQQYGKERFEKWIAWLEKQGQQKPAEWTHKDGKNLAELWGILSVNRNTNPQVDNLMEWVKDLVSYKRQEWGERFERIIRTI